MEVLISNFKDVRSSLIEEKKSHLRALKKIFLVTGYSRSGTTLMGEILGSSESVFTLAETHFFENMVDGNAINEILPIEKQVAISRKFFIRAHKGILAEANASSDELALCDILVKDLIQNYPRDLSASDLYLYMLDVLAKHYRVPIICEQTGKYLFFIDTYSSFDVELKIFHMIRNPLDVIQSEALKYRVKFLGLSEIPWSETVRVFISFNPILLSLVIKGFDNSFKGIQSRFGKRIVRKFKYESLFETKHFFEILSQFADLIDLDPNKVEFWGSSISKSNTNRARGIIKPTIYASSTQSVRVDAGHFWVSVLLKNYCDENGYLINTNWKRSVSGVVWGLITPIQLFFIFILNYHRAPNFISALARRLF